MAYSSVNAQDFTLGVIIVGQGSRLTDTIRDIFRESRKLKARKLNINIVSEALFHEIVPDIREALLDNIEYSISLYTWRLDQVDDMVKKMLEIGDLRGVILTCVNPEDKGRLTRVRKSLGTKLISLMMGDLCTERA